MLKTIARNAEFNVSIVKNNSDTGRLGAMEDLGSGVADATIGPLSVRTTTYPIIYSTTWMDTGGGTAPPPSPILLFSPFLFQLRQL